MPGTLVAENSSSMYRLLDKNKVDVNNSLSFNNSMIGKFVYTSKLLPRWDELEISWQMIFFGRSRMKLGSYELSIDWFGSLFFLKKMLNITNDMWKSHSMEIPSHPRRNKCVEVESSTIFNSDAAIVFYIKFTSTDWDLVC